MSLPSEAGVLMRRGMGSLGHPHVRTPRRPRGDTAEGVSASEERGLGGGGRGTNLLAL